MPESSLIQTPASANNQDGAGEVTLRRDEDRRRRTVDIYFGAKKHGGVVNEYENSFVKRPELIRSLKCKGAGMTECTECTVESGCWHGTGYSPYTEIEVDENSGFTDYVT